MVGGILIGALSISLLVTGATVTLAQNSARPSEPAANVGDAKGIPLPSPELLEHQSKPNCEIPPSDRLPGAIPDRAQLMYERECYKTAETVVRTKLQLLQDAIASTIKALNDAAASRTLQPAEGGEQGAPAPANDAVIAPKAAASAAKSSEATGTAGDRRDAKSDPSGDQGVEPPDQHRNPTPSARLSVNPSSREVDVPKSSSPDAAVSEPAQTPNVSAQSKPVTASAKAIACQTSKPAGRGHWAWRLIDGRKCWYEGAVRIKALNDAAASKTLQPAEGGEQGAPAPANDAAIAPKAAASAAKSSEATGTAGDRRDAKSDPSRDQGVEPPDQHRNPTPSARLSINPSSQEGDVPASVKAVACQTSSPAGHGHWAWRLIDGRKCWYEGAVGMDKSLLHWLPFKEVPAPE
jgi:hypothetical protein